jgi:fatty acid/phospholipid biosynthesis enzyme
LPRWLVIEGLEDGRERVEVVEERDVVAFEGEVVEGGRRGKRQSLEVAVEEVKVSRQEMR